MTVEQVVEIDGASPLMPAVLALRHTVFVVEQQVPAELELDEFDRHATHLAAVRDGHVVGTLRILDDSGSARIGRVAVRADLRRGGIGSVLMDRAESLIRRRGLADIVLHAQISVRDFYLTLGYVEEGVEFEEAGIPHIAMRKRLV